MCVRVFTRLWLRLTPTLLQFQLKHEPTVSADPDPETKSSRFLRVGGGRLLACSLGEADWSLVVAAGVCDAAAGETAAFASVAMVTWRPQA